jgi:hypothetical protein
LDTTSRVISLKATPQLAFEPLSPVCSNVEPYWINHAKILIILSGNGFYSGLGITPAGKFYPEKWVMDWIH